MRRTHLNIALFAGIVVTVAMTVSMRRDPTRPNYMFLPEMVYSVAYDAFAPNPVFADGQTLQAPVPGTIARGALPLRYAATPEDALRAGEELANPFALPAGDDADDESRHNLERGDQVYRSFCIPCHGPTGNGDGPVALRGYPPPPSLLAEHAVHMKDGQMFHVLTYGQGNMASYAAQVSPEDRWNAVLHVRAMQQRAAARSNEEAQP
ncbi:MAG TPA: cytochrome c [Candidatus Hydrogenedentes bacterium]|nr:cytochrome c [Candidatus Hydrogenedentota bacterium]